MNGKLKEIAMRIRELRQILEISKQDAAKKVGVTLAEYEAAEEGRHDFSATFLLKLSKLFKVDVTDLLTGKSPTLSNYTLVRAGEGLKIDRRKGFEYKNLAYQFKNRNAQPFIVTAPFEKENTNKAIELSSHKGQEFNYVLSGSLKFTINGKEEILNAGDSVYYDSQNYHGMVAVGGECVFLAILIN